LEQKHSFVQLVSEPASAFAEVCRAFRIRRQTGYKWLGRYRQAGLSGLADQSRRPQQSPHATAAVWVERLRLARRRRKRWGAKKRRAWLQGQHPRSRIPSASTLGRLLRRPGDTASQEQWHRELKADTTRPPSATPHAQQRRFQNWLHDYNEERPHEALGLIPPAQVYYRSRRPYRGARPPPLPAWRDRPASAAQWREILARSQSFYRRSFRPATRRAQTVAAGSLARLFLRLAQR